MTHQITSTPAPRESQLQLQLQSQSPPHPPLLQSPKSVAAYNPVHKTLASAANLANLLPTGTVLAFQTLTPSFSNQGVCQLSNTCLTASLIAFCAIVCFLSTFTDSFVDSNGKIYYGIATFKGLYIFNNEETTEEVSARDLTKFRIRLIDFVHAFVSLLVFLTFAFCDSDVQSCFFPSGGTKLYVLVMNLPLAAGISSSFLFMVFPCTRRGIGYADMPANTFKLNETDAN